MSAPPIPRALTASTYSQRDHWDDASPCPICGRNGWCRITRDRQMVLCRRAMRPDGVERKVRDGVAYLHRLTPGELPEFDVSAAEDEAPAVQPAPPTKCDAVYRALLAACPLTADHLAALQARGFTSDQIAAAGFGSLTDADPVPATFQALGGRRVLDDVPGFFQGRDRDYRVAGGTGLLIPVRDAEGRIARMRLRVDDPKGGGRYRYLSAAKGFNAAKSGVAVHVPVGARALGADPSTPWVLTEGELKAERVVLAWQRPALGIPGVGSWPLALPVLAAVGARAVCLAWDADARTNPAVANALRAAVVGLSGAGFAVSIATWHAPLGADGKPSPKGIDDALAVGEPITVHEGLAALEALEAIVAGAKPDPAADAELVIARAVEAVREKRRAPGDVLEDRAVIDAVAVVLEHAPERWPALRERLKAVKVAPKALQDAARIVRRQQANAAAVETTDDRVAIRLHEDEEPREVSEAVEALAGVPTLFARGETLVEVRAVTQEEAEPADGSTPRVQRSPGAPTARLVPGPRLREMIATRARFYREVVEDDGGVKRIPARVPEYLVPEVRERGDWPRVRSLTSIAESPFLRPDGTLCTTAGYDDATGVLLPRAPALPALPEAPTREDAQAAAAVLLDLVADFPFASPAHASAWLAALLTPIARPALGTEAVPLFLVDGNRMGTGKTRLVQLIAEILFGRSMAVSTISEDEEMRKNITTIALSGDPAVLYDDTTWLGGKVLCRLLTNPGAWRDRLLGFNREVVLPVTATFYASGNNVAVHGDVVRRVLHVRLVTQDVNPDARQQFTRPRILQDVRTHRGEYLAAALTILRAYCAAGRPEQPMPAWGSFEAWSDLVRGALVWAGQPDPYEVTEQLRAEHDDARTGLVALVEGWAEVVRARGGAPLSAREAIATLAADDDEVLRRGGAQRFGLLREALAVLCGADGGRLPSAKALGKTLASHRETVVACSDGVLRSIARAKADRKGILRWTTTEAPAARPVLAVPTTTEAEPVATAEPTDEPTAGAVPGLPGLPGSFPPSRGSGEFLRDEDFTCTRVEGPRNPAQPANPAPGSEPTSGPVSTAPAPAPVTVPDPPPDPDAPDSCATLGCPYPALSGDRWCVGCAG